MRKIVSFILMSFLVFQACEASQGNNTKGVAEVEGKVNSIEIVWNDGTVYVAHSYDSIVRFYEKATVDLTESNSLSYRFVDGDLDIYYGPNGQNNIGDIDKELYVYVPINMELDDLKVSSNSGEIQVDINSDEADIRSGSGAISYSNSLKEFGTSISSTSGNISLALPAKASFTLDWTTESGRLVNEDFAFNQIDGKYVCGEGDASLKVSTVSGNLLLSKKTN